ncbi:MAG: NAD regulator, partial [Hyphomicrobiales bacterium]|nr:NAD regulator [Hyphomicrobiales bacterium]
RNGKPEILIREIEPRLKEWARRAHARDGEPALSPTERLRICFAIGATSWDEEKTLERYELLYEAGLMAEAARDGRDAATLWDGLPSLGRPMRHDHRRILATAMGRLRAKLKYRPVIFELMPDAFTLFELQKMVEAIFGAHLHKQNFRRLVENAGLVEPTGDVSTATGGRPAKCYRFRREVLLERPAPGVRVKAGRG